MPLHVGDYTWVGFTVDLAVTPTIEPIDGVGSIYDIAINRRGLNLFHGGDQYRDLFARRVTTPLEAERYAQGDTPFSEGLNRYFFTGWSDLSSGAGQVMRDRPTSVPTRYYHSQGVNPFVVPGEISLLPDTLKVHEVTGQVRLYQAQAILYAIDLEDNTIAAWDRDTDSFDVTPVAVPAQIVDVTSDGVSLYLACDDGIRTYNEDDGLVVWSTKVVGRINWVYERIAVSMPYDTALSNNSYWTLGNDGLFDTPGSAPGDDSLALPWLAQPDGWEIRDSVAGGGFVWFPAAAFSKSTVFRWKPDSGDVPQPSWELPANELATAVFQYQGQVLVRASIIDESPGPEDTIAARIYQCAVGGEGALVPFLLLTITEDDLNNGQGSFYGGGRFVSFGWSNMDDDESRAGLGQIDLATGGWSRGVITPEADGVTTGAVQGITEFDGEIFFAVGGQGVWRTIPTRVPHGYLETDAVDKASTLVKSVSDVRAVFDPLAYGARVTIEVSFDRGGSWLDFGWEQAQAGSQELLARLDRQLRTYSMRTHMYRASPDTTKGPIITIQQVQMHQTGLVDEVFELPIDCSDTTFAPSGAQVRENGWGEGPVRARWLESLTNQDIAIQDTDWPYDETIRIYQVVGVETRILPRYNESRGVNELAQVAIVQARRPQE